MINQHSQAIVLLRRYLRDNNTTQEEYAQMVGVSSATVSSFMTEKNLRRSSYMKIMKGFPNPFIKIRKPGTTTSETKPVAKKIPTMTIEQLQGALKYLRKTLSATEIQSQLGMSASHYSRIYYNNLQGKPRQSLLDQYAALPIIRAYLEDKLGIKFDSEPVVLVQTEIKSIEKTEPTHIVKVTMEEKTPILPVNKYNIVTAQNLLDKVKNSRKAELDELESLNKMLKESGNTQIGKAILPTIVSRIEAISGGIATE